MQSSSNRDKKIENCGKGFVPKKQQKAIKSFIVLGMNMSRLTMAWHFISVVTTQWHNKAYESLKIKPGLETAHGLKLDFNSINWKR